MKEARRLRLVLGEYPHTKALKDGRMELDGIAFDSVEVPSLQEAFKRMCREICYDVCEMSITGYMLACRYGLPFTAIPVFPARGFPQSHAAIVVDKREGLSSPGDLAGKRVGARTYTGTASLWVRGALQDDYGLALEEVTWVSVEEEHVPKFGQDTPRNVSYELGCDPAQMLHEGSISAAIGISVASRAGFAPLIEDARTAAAHFARQSGIYQINHTIVIRNALLEEQPSLGRSLAEAFLRAKQHWLETSPDVPVANELRLENNDPFPYGIDENRTTIEALLRYSREQGLIEQVLSPEECSPLRM